MVLVTFGIKGPGSCSEVTGKREKDGKLGILGSWVRSRGKQVPEMQGLKVGGDKIVLSNALVSQICRFPG